MDSANQTNVLSIGKNPVFILAVILLITILTFSNSINNDFTNWDDTDYVVNNKYIKDFSWKGMKNIFTNFYASNYHPLTALTNAIEYKFFRLNPKPIHFFNLLLHLFNVVLVFYFIFLLTKRVEASAIVAVFFAIHPMHVESVAWISERKDVLYSFFYLSSLIAYIRLTPVPSPKERGEEARGKSLSKGEGFRVRRGLFVSLFLFLLSLLSKSAAVTLPIILLLIDFFFKRKFSKETLLEKIPFFVLSLIFVIIALYAQKTSGALDQVGIHTLPDKIFLPCYAICFYVFKMFLPVKLCVLHFYPEKTNGLFPLQYYLSLPIIVFFIFAIYKWGKHNKDLIFGSLFFLISIALVLQIVPAGFAIAAERYTYLSYIGLFFIIGQGYCKIAEPNLKTIATVFLAGAVVCFSILAFQRNKVWRNGVTLFTDVINKNPVKPNKLLHIQPIYALVYNNRAVAKENLNDFASALIDYEQAILIDPKYKEAYFNCGSLKLNLKDYEGAITNFNEVMRLDDYDAEAYYSRAAAKLNLNKTSEGCDDLYKAAQLGYGNAEELIQQYCK